MDLESTTLVGDASVGRGAGEECGGATGSSGAFVAGERLTHALSSVATFTQLATGLWSMDDTSEALYTFGLGLAATLTDRTQVKVDFLDTYKNQPPLVSIKKNDTALVTSVVFKF